MIEEVGYMPLLKSRAGEFRALRSLTRSQRSQLLPLMDLVPPLWDFEKEAPTRSMDEHASLVSPHLWRSWGPDLPILLDGQNLDTDTAERNPLEQIIEGCRARGIQAIPVTGLDRSQEYQSAVRRSLTRDRRGSCIRLESEDLAAIGRLEAALKDLMESLGLDPSNVDLLVDLRAISEEEEAALAKSVLIALDRLSWVPEWRSVTLSGSAFPENLAFLPPDSTSAIPRVEWTLWKMVASKCRARGLRLRFGDYAIAHPIPLEIDPRGMRMSANLRYTGNDSWTVLRGRNVQKYGTGQFTRLCRELVESNDFCGGDFSPGDRLIEKCAGGIVPPGNATTWREIGTSHHIQFVLRQLDGLRQARAYRGRDEAAEAIDELPL